MRVDNFVGGKGVFVETDYVPTQERTNNKCLLILTTGRILSQYIVGAQTRRTENMTWFPEDLLEIHPHDAKNPGINEGDTTVKATIAERAKKRSWVLETS